MKESCKIRTQSTSAPWIVKIPPRPKLKTIQILDIHLFLLYIYAFIGGLNALDDLMYLTLPLTALVRFLTGTDPSQVK
jgi:hypothetical protein